MMVEVVTSIVPQDLRLQPLYRAAEAARYLGVNDDTLRTWAFGYRRPGHLGRPSVHKGPVITATANRRGPSIPFMGLAEGMVLAAFRKAGLPMQRIRPAVAILREQIGLEHALASQSLYTDGARILYDFAEHYDLDELSDLVV